jgi:hypothetical protein
MSPPNGQHIPRPASRYEAQLPRPHTTHVEAICELSYEMAPRYRLYFRKLKIYPRQSLSLLCQSHPISTY